MEVERGADDVLAMSARQTAAAGARPVRRTSRRSAEEQLVQCGLPLVHHLVADVARRVPRSVPREDLASAGMLGLAQAARMWDASRGVSFECYARARIRGAILDELRSRDWASRSVRAESRQLLRATEELTTELGRAPSAGELADRLQVSEATLQRLTDDIHRATVLSFDTTITEIAGTGATTPGEEGPSEALLACELRAYLSDAVVALPERLRKVVVEYFFEERPMQDIADDLGVTESRVSQMRAEALALLKDGINSQLDPEQVPDLGVDHGRVGKRKAAYYAAVAAASDFRTRISADAPSLPQRIAAAG